MVLKNCDQRYDKMTAHHGWTLPNRNMQSRRTTFFDAVGCDPVPNILLDSSQHVLNASRTSCIIDTRPGGIDAVRFVIRVVHIYR